MTERRRRRNAWPYVALGTALVIAIGAALWAWREPLWALVGDRERLQAWVARLGPWGPLATIGLNIAQVILAPIPGQIVGVMNGYLYGIAAGTLYSMIGLVIGTATAMVLGRRFGRPLVERLVNPTQLARWDDITAHAVEIGVSVLEQPDLLVRQVVIPQLHPEIWENVADATRFRTRVLGAPTELDSV